MADQATLPTANIDSVLQEQRKFEPPEEFRRSAHIKSLEDYERIYREFGITAQAVADAAQDSIRVASA